MDIDFLLMRIIKRDGKVKVEFTVQCADGDQIKDEQELVGDKILIEFQEVKASAVNEIH